MISFILKIIVFKSLFVSGIFFIFFLSHLLFGIVLKKIFFEKNKTKQFSETKIIIIFLIGFLLKAFGGCLYYGVFNQTLSVILEFFKKNNHIFKPSFLFIIDSVLRHDLEQLSLNVKIINKISIICTIFVSTLFYIIFMIDVSSENIDELNKLNFQPPRIITAFFLISAGLIVFTKYGSLLNFITVLVFISFCSLFCLLGIIKMFLCRRLIYKEFMTNMLYLMIIFSIIILITRIIMNNEVAITVVNILFVLIGIIFAFVDKKKLEVE